MKFSYNWIRELVSGLEVDARELGRLITMKTAECEGVELAGVIDLDAGPGEPVPGCPPDSVIEIDNKSLTHRPDLWGHYGMAREVAAIVRRPLIDPVRTDRIPAGGAAVSISIEDYDLCPRYSALVFDNVTVGPSPRWLQCRLETVGLNPINNIVDVTNFVMAELAQPMHAFDHDTLHGEIIFVRCAREGEMLAALNGETYRLDPSNIVIADAVRAIAIGGVIGGLETGISSGTRRMVLESANFHAASIRRTSTKLKLRTDASIRFEKSQDPVNTVRGLARAVELLHEVSPGIRLVGGLVDAGRALRTPPPITLDLDWLERKLGRAVDAAEVREILAGLEFGVAQTGPRLLSVSVPSWRSTKDVSLKDDLVEEVGRVIGYDSITPVPPSVAATVPPRNEERLFHHDLRAVAAAQGFTEVYNYSFVSEEMVRAFRMEPAEHLAVANPIASDQGLLRMSLLPGIHKNIRDNSRHLDDFRLFEIGCEIHKQPAGLPNEVAHLVAALYCREGDGSAGLFECKRLAECLMPQAELRPAPPRPFEHPARSYSVHWRGSFLGRLFEFHSSMVEGRAAVVDLDIDLMHKLQPLEKRYRPLRRFPTSAFDLSIVAGLRELVGDIRRQLVAHAGEALESIEFLRQYSGPPLPDGVKSVSFRLVVGARDHTLSADEVGAVRTRIIDAMRAAGYDLRL